MIIIAVVCVAAYWNSLEVPFVFDDRSNISENPHIRISRLDWQQLRDAAFESRSHQRPVANLSFALNHYVGQDRVQGYHVVNVCIHVINGILVYLLGLATFPRASAGSAKFPPATIQWMSLAAALVFISHPIQTQAVTYIVQRMTSLAALFYLSALLLYIGGRTADGARRWTLWGVGLVCWLFALGSKQISATLPILVFLYEWYFFRDLSRDWLRRSLKIALPAIALMGVVVLAYLGENPLERLLRGYDVREFTMGERVLTQFRVLNMYLGLVIWPLPSRFSITHDISVSHSLLDPATTLLSLFTLLALLLAAVLTARRHRIVSFCILWFFLHLVIESSVVALELAYEHRMYLPIVGLSMLATWGLFSVVRDERWAIAATTALILLFSMATIQRNDVWQDARTLWRDVLAKYPQDARAHNNLGDVEDEAGDHSAAMKSVVKAIQLEPDYQKAYVNRGLLYAKQGEFGRALEDFDHAIDIAPEAVKWWPSYGEAHRNRGVILLKTGSIHQAIRDFSKAIELNENNAPDYSSRSVAYAATGRFDLAIDDAVRAVELDDGSASAHNILAWILATGNDPAFRNGRKAVQHATRACEISGWRDVGNLDTLAAAYAESGDFESAVRVAREAIEIEKRRNPPNQLEVLRDHLALFEARQPLRDPG